SETPTRSPEVQPSQVSFKTVFTVSFAVLIVAGLTYAVSQALVAVALTGAALLIAVSLEHLVRALQRRGLSRPLSIAIVILAAVGVLVGFGFTLIPPAVWQGRQLIKATPGFLHNVRESAFFQRLDLRFHLAEQMDHAVKQLPDLLEGAASPVLAAVGGVL